MPIDDPRAIRNYHDALLFVIAHPDDRSVLRQVDRELLRIRRVVQSRTSGQVRRLENSGIAGSHVVCPFSLDICRWLTNQFGREVRLEWENDDGSESFGEFLNHLAAPVERDGLLCERLSTREWIRVAAGRGRADLSWLIQQVDAMPASEVVREQAFDTLDLAVRWSLRGRRSSRTLVRFPPRPLHWQTGDFLRSPNAETILEQSVPAARPLPATNARAVLDACRATLCVRRREIDTLTYANDREVYLFRQEHGIDIAVFGMSPDRRLPIESYFGFVVARNRVPIGYGGGWVFMERCEIGVNIFDEFRGGESALAFACVLRVFRHHFRAGYFTVDPFQFGAGNTEAIRSGAFWFYYRLGFRPIDPRTAKLAENEHCQLSSDRKYRCPPSALRRLAGARLRLDLRSAANAAAHAPEIIDIGLAVTRWIGKRFAGNRKTAEAWAVRRASKVLGATGLSRWPVEERSAFERLSPLVAMTTWSNRCPSADRKSLVRLMRAKGGKTERSYVMRLQAHEAFKGLLGEVAKAGGRIAKGARP